MTDGKCYNLSPSIKTKKNLILVNMRELSRIFSIGKSTLYISRYYIMLSHISNICIFGTDNTPSLTTINLRTKDPDLTFLINSWSLNDNLYDDQLIRVIIIRLLFLYLRM